MNATLDTATMDALILRAREKFRRLLQDSPQLFGGEHNPRIAHTISETAPLGTNAVPAGRDVYSTSGLMAGVDLTLLDPAATEEQIRHIAARGVRDGAATICVYPQHVALVQQVTRGAPPPIAVVGFPSVEDPVTALAGTLAETRTAIRDGAREIDMVLPASFAQANPDYTAHYQYIRAVVEEAGKAQVPVKLILETACLTDAQKIEACLLAKIAGAAWVKTSTGFADPACMRPEIPPEQKGATPEDIALMRRTVGDTTLTDDGRVMPMGVKASGGVRTREQVMEYYWLGADRIGASGGLDLRSMLEKQVTDRRAAAPKGRIMGDY